MAVIDVKGTFTQDGVTYDLEWTELNQGDSFLNQDGKIHALGYGKGFGLKATKRKPEFKVDDWVKMVSRHKLDHIDKILPAGSKFRVGRADGDGFVLPSESSKFRVDPKYIEPCDKPEFKVGDWVMVTENNPCSSSAVSGVKYQIVHVNHSEVKLKLNERPYVPFCDLVACDPPKHRPFKNAAEFFEFADEWVSVQGTGGYSRVSRFSDGGATISGVVYSYERALDCCQFAKRNKDGLIELSPFGVLDE